MQVDGFGDLSGQGAEMVGNESLVCVEQSKCHYSRAGAEISMPFSESETLHFLIASGAKAR